MSGEGQLEGHLRTSVPAGGHGYGTDDLAESAERFGDLAALHAADHQSEASWAARLQDHHTHPEPPP